MLQTNIIARVLTELSPRPWTMCLETGSLVTAGGVLLATVRRDADLDWIANSPELVEMLLHEIRRLQRHLRTPRRPDSQLFQRETGGVR